MSQAYSPSAHGVHVLNPGFGCYERPAANADMFCSDDLAAGKRCRFQQRLCHERRLMSDSRRVTFDDPQLEELRGVLTTIRDGVGIGSAALSQPQLEVLLRHFPDLSDDPSGCVQGLAAMMRNHVGRFVPFRVNDAGGGLVSLLGVVQPRRGHAAPHISQLVRRDSP